MGFIRFVQLAVSGSLQDCEADGVSSVLFFLLALQIHCALLLSRSMLASVIRMHAEVQVGIAPLERHSVAWL